LRHTRLFGNGDHYVAAVEVMQIIGEGTEGLEDLGSRIVLVPGCLEFQARDFYGLSRQQVLDSDGKNAAHEPSPAKIARYTVLTYGSYELFLWFGAVRQTETN